MWFHGTAPFDLKKRIVRAVIKEIVVYVEAATLRVLVHWQGGQHTKLNLRQTQSGRASLEDHREHTRDHRTIGGEVISDPANSGSAPTTWGKLLKADMATISMTPSYAATGRMGVAPLA